MTYPFSVQVTFDFSSGPTFGYSFILDDPAHGLLDTNVLADAASNVVDISSQVQKISISGGYNLTTDQFEATTCTLRIYDPLGYWNPQNTASPYYGQIIPNRKVRVSTLYGTTAHFLFSGYASSYNYQYPKDTIIGYVDILCTDAFRLWQLTTVTTVPGAINGQTTGARINSILDAISWPATMRSIDTGDSYCQADPGSVRTALGALKVVEATEQGAFYVTGEGNAIFKSRSNVMKTNGAAPITIFNNDGTAIGYNNITFAHDDKLIINSTTVTNIGGTAQNSTDAASQILYYPHNYAMPNLVGQTDADALNIAALYTATRKDTTIRIDNITLDLTTPDYAAGIAAGLTLDYFNTVQITTNTQNATSIVKTLQIMGNAYEITPVNFMCKFTTSEPIDDSFILDSTLYGLLDTSILTY
jgi:hypothetical protein